MTYCGSQYLAELEVPKYFHQSDEGYKGKRLNVDSVLVNWRGNNLHGRFSCEGFGDHGWINMRYGEEVGCCGDRAIV